MYKNIQIHHHLHRDQVTSLDSGANGGQCPPSIRFSFSILCYCICSCVCSCICSCVCSCICSCICTWVHCRLLKSSMDCSQFFESTNKMCSSPSGCFLRTGITPPRARAGSAGTGGAQGRRKFCPLIAPRCHCCLLTISFPFRHGNISSPSPVLDSLPPSGKVGKQERSS